MKMPADKEDMRKLVATGEIGKMPVPMTLQTSCPAKEGRITPSGYQSKCKNDSKTYVSPACKLK